MITMALEAMAVSCSGKVLEPGVCMTDHSDGERLGFMHTWPDAYHAQCWPHISRKMKAGTLGKTYFRRKKHEDDDEEDGEDGASDEPNQNKQKKVKDLCKDHPKFVDICMHLKCFHHCQSEPGGDAVAFEFFRNGVFEIIMARFLNVFSMFSILLS